MNFSKEGYNEIEEKECEMLRIIFKKLTIKRLEIRFPNSIPDHSILKILDSLSHIKHKKLVLSAISTHFLDNQAYLPLFIDKYAPSGHPPKLLSSIDPISSYFNTFAFNNEVTYDMNL